MSNKACNAKKRYYPQHMHIHSIYEPGASMEGHIYFAEMQGIKHMWFTEHDILWDKKPYKLSFEAEELLPDENGVPTKHVLPSYNSQGDVCIDNSDFYDGSSSLRLTAKENYSDRWIGASVSSIGKGICQSLCRMPMLSFSHRGVKKSEGDVRYIFDVLLSERPPHRRFAHIIFVCGSSEGLDAPHTLIVPITVGDEWQKSSFDISSIATSDSAMLASVGGMDNVISTLTIKVETRNGASASLFVDALEVEGRTTAEETKSNQTVVAAEIGKKYGVTPFVTAEISVGGHKNCFSTNTPVFKYGDPDNPVTNEDSCREMLSRGQVFSINHPFVHLKHAAPDVDYDAECDAVIETLAENNAYGASLLEIGFPFGRFASYETHTRLWDSLALRGVILTGYGATDSHMMTEGWFSGNNFASYVGVDSQIVPTESDFSAAMKAGALYAANPLEISGDVSFLADGNREMGSVIVMPEGSESNVSLSLEITNHNWKVAWVVNGKRVRLDTATRTGYHGEYILTTTGGIDFVRAEVYDYLGTLLFMTNPIYFVSDLKNIKNDVKSRVIYDSITEENNA